MALFLFGCAVTSQRRRGDKTLQWCHSLDLSPSRYLRVFGASLVREYLHKRSVCPMSLRGHYAQTCFDDTWVNSGILSSCHLPQRLGQDARAARGVLRIHIYQKACFVAVVRRKQIWLPRSVAVRARSQIEISAVARVKGISDT